MTAQDLALLPLAPVLLALLAYDHVHRGAVRITRSQAVIAAVFISLANRKVTPIPAEFLARVAALS